nr:MAG TPA: hypothetical protein [Caudoviricetes sp.]
MAKNWQTVEKRNKKSKVIRGLLFICLTFKI